MADVTVKRIDEFEPTFGGGMLKVRAGLGVESFGMQVLRVPAERGSLSRPTTISMTARRRCTWSLEGVATLRAGGEEHELAARRLRPGRARERRKLVTGDAPGDGSWRYGGESRGGVAAADHGLHETRASPTPSPRGAAASGTGRRPRAR